MRRFNGDIGTRRTLILKDGVALGEKPALRRTRSEARFPFMTMPTRDRPGASPCQISTSAPAISVARPCSRRCARRCRRAPAPRRLPAPRDADRRAHERPIVRPERPQADSVIGPVTEIGLQIGGRHPGVLTPPRKRDTSSSRWSRTRSDKSPRASLVAFSRGVANLSIRGLSRRNPAPAIHSLRSLPGPSRQPVAPHCHRPDGTVISGRGARP